MDNNKTQTELAVIGALLLDDGQRGDILQEINSDCFSGADAKALYAAIADLHLSGAPIDPLTVLDKAGDRYDEAVRAALELAPPGPDVPYYCAMLRRGSQLARLQSAAMAIMEAASLEDAITHLDTMSAMTVSRDGVKIVTAAEAAQAFYDRATATQKPEYIRLGLPTVDSYLYLQRGDLLVIGGYASAGKTLLSLQIAANLGKKYRVGYYSLETNTDKLTDRIMSHLSGVPLRKIKDRDFSETDWLGIGTAATMMSGLNIDLVEVGGMTVRDIQSIARNRRHEIVIVDYLQLVIGDGRDTYERVTNVSKGLHTLARVNNVLVIALAQLRRPDNDKGKPKPPTMHDFRESGQIEQDADVALLVYPSKPNDNTSDRKLKIAKNKEGRKDVLTLAFDGATQTLRERPPEDDDDEDEDDYWNKGRHRK